jgi:hypothetical protein
VAFAGTFLPSFFPAAFLQSPRSVAIGRQTGSVQELNPTLCRLQKDSF